MEAFGSFDGRYVYYAKLRNSPGIWRIPVASGEEERVLDRGVESSWGLTERGIVLMNKWVKPQSFIEFYDFESGSLSTLAHLQAGLKFDLANPSFAVTRDGRWLLYTKHDSWGSDIEVIDRLR